ncbi:TetR/AcrR family transcriptional regulator [Mycolicibacterium chlorophenolicum]|uniref:HTH-type transcriptional repressor KstR2 n=1 Tax=Mycolicibacterium chlorophenolicum TaxID=37916 RepID=A0A0J6WNH7_9MYCO|nr:TetR/AcrR family transcriptional regulator [Mycolicibacterium chlorophenolicum]KMO83633.1 HTH-type transcriptional repressor KstR2 [Mycolicibacterium chlorophenolicum]
MGARPSRRDQILDAALELFATQGITATTTRDVAARAGVATGSVFYHFATKPDLIEAVLGRAYVGPDLQTIADRSDRPVRERLLEAAQLFLATLRQRRALLSVAIQAALVDDRYRLRVRANIDDEIGVLAAILDRTPGATTSSLSSRAIAATLLRSLVTTAVLHPEPIAGEHAFIALTVDLFVAGAHGPGPNAGAPSTEILSDSGR